MRSNFAHGLPASMLLAAFVAVSPAKAQGPSPPAASGDVAANLLRGRIVSDNARVRVEDQELLILTPPVQGALQGVGEQVLRLPQPLLERLSRLDGRSLRTLAVQRPTHGGMMAAVRLEDANGVVAIAEAIRDVPALTLEERLGLEVRPVPGGQRTFVFETECQVTYNVPSEVIAGDRHTVVQPGATEILQAAGRRYRFTLVRSSFVLQKSCVQTFEGAVRQIDYFLERD
jgi:hypothetical protein